MEGGLQSECRTTCSGTTASGNLRRMLFCHRHVHVFAALHSEIYVQCVWKKQNALKQETTKNCEGMCTPNSYAYDMYSPTADLIHEENVCAPITKHA